MVIVPPPKSLFSASFRTLFLPIPRYASLLTHSNPSYSSIASRNQPHIFFSLDTSLCSLLATALSLRASPSSLSWHAPWWIGMISMLITSIAPMMSLSLVFVGDPMSTLMRSMTFLSIVKWPRLSCIPQSLVGCSIRERSQS